MNNSFNIQDEIISLQFNLFTFFEKLQLSSDDLHNPNSNHFHQLNELKHLILSNTINNDNNNTINQVLLKMKVINHILTSFIIDNQKSTNSHLFLIINYIQQKLEFIDLQSDFFTF